MVIAFQSSPILSLPRARSRVFAVAVAIAPTSYPSMDRTRAINLVYDEIRAQTLYGDTSTGDGDSDRPFAIFVSAVHGDTSFAMRDDDVIAQGGNRSIIRRLVDCVVLFR